MRVFPFGLMFLEDIEKAETWAVAHSSMTHQDPIALAACVAMTVGMVHVLNGREVEDLLSGMVEVAMRYSDKTGDMIQRAVDEAKTGVETRVTLQRLQVYRKRSCGLGQWVPFFQMDLEVISPENLAWPSGTPLKHQPS